MLFDVFEKYVFIFNYFMGARKKHYNGIQNPSSHTEEMSGIMKRMWVKLLTVNFLNFKIRLRSNIVYTSFSILCMNNTTVDVSNDDVITCNK